MNVLDDDPGAFRININNLNIPISRAGIVGDVYVPDPDPLVNGSGGKYKNEVFLFSGGFFLSGYQQSNLWTNGVASASLVQDYLPGKIGSDANAPENKIYVVKSSDPAFSQSWQDWRTAVENGAYFYDGDNDGIYNPVDLNNNGIWDANEDRPDLNGDITTWCVYNDGVPANDRRFGVDPIGIEIRQSIFGVAGTVENAFHNSLILRYSIINKTTSSERLDSVYFGIWADPDLGDASDDLNGCVPNLNSGFVYNNGTDQVYGDNCPAVMFTLLQSPPIYIPGVTYQDINQNQQYDEGIDIPLDTAYNKLGKYIGVEAYPGAKNVGINSSTMYIGGDPTWGDPDNSLQARNYLNGKMRNGNLVDPCNFNYGQVIGEDCNLIANNLLFSGNPVIPQGWIDVSGSDKRVLLSVGPFDLEHNVPVDIICAYIVGQGATSLTSVDVAKSYAVELINSCGENFSDLPTSIKDNNSDFIVNKYELLDNYPNPFNPVTTIKYGLTDRTNVRIDVFDVLGRKITTLVNEQKEAGYHTVQFEGSNLASGMYIYKLTAGSFTSTKKMMMLR